MADRTLELLAHTSADPHRRILLRGGFVLSMDPTVGDFVGDVLIEGSVVADIGPVLTDARAGEDVIKVDASGSIVMPGFVDSHLHAWQGQLSGLAPDISLAEYMTIFRRGFASHYRPDDMRIGNLLASLRCLNSGITCMIDNSHNARSAEHSNAAIEGLLGAGLRAVHASGAPAAGAWDEQWPVDLLRLREEYFSTDDQLLTLRIFTGGMLEREAWEFARRHDLWVSSEIGVWNESIVSELAAAGLMTSHHTFNHCSGLSDDMWSLIQECGVSVNVCPRSDTTFGVGPAVIPVDEALTRDISTGISMDTEVSYGVDMFAEMRTLLHLTRGRVARAAAEDPDHVPAPIDVYEVLKLATVGGAANAGLSDRIGSLSPGKEADILLIRPDALSATTPGNLAAAVVSFMSPANVEAVFVAGQVRKWRGELYGHDLPHVNDLAETSRNYLFAAYGLALDPFAPPNWETVD